MNARQRRRVTREWERVKAAYWARFHATFTPEKLIDIVRRSRHPLVAFEFGGVKLNPIGPVVINRGFSIDVLE